MAFYPQNIKNAQIWPCNMTLLTLKMTPRRVENISIELGFPQNPYFDPEILSLVLLEDILSQKYPKITNLTL